MKKLLLGLLLGAAALAALPSSVSAQCIAVGGVNNVPQPGIVCLSEPIADTYAATSVGLIPAAAATDIACITGSATKIVRLQSIRISGSGTAISVPVIITKHASANTGGTPAVTTALPVPYALDSTDATVSATTTAYTANPTITDAAPGLIDNANLGLVATTVGAGVQNYILFDYSSRNYSEAPTLRGIAQQVCVNLNGTTPTALLNISFRWTELAQ